jgi:hypothetical protein
MYMMALVAVDYIEWVIKKQGLKLIFLALDLSLLFI